MGLLHLPMRELRELLLNQQLSAVELIQETYKRIDNVEPHVRAFIRLQSRDKMLQNALSIDQRRARGIELPPFSGIPIAVKDNISVAGMPLTCGSRMLETFISPYDATAVSHICEAGFLVLGKTNMDEFAMGSSTENSAFFPTANPHNLSYVPGGTSGGSAAAVAALASPIAIGSDTGGSVRQPASFCGVVGLKPSYGRVSRYGLVAYASSLDQVGILARDVLDSALLLSVIAKNDPLDSTSSTLPGEDYTNQALTQVSRCFRVGIPREYTNTSIDPKILECLRHCLELLERDGCVSEEVSLPHTEAALPTYYIIASSEASSNLNRYEGVKYGYRSPEDLSLVDMMTASRSEGFGPEVKRRIMLGTFALSHGYRDAYYNRAVKIRRLIAKDFHEVFRMCDFLLHPVSPTLPWKFGEKSEDPLTMYLSDILSVPASLAGLPAVVVPCGFTSEGLPIGLQVTGPPFSEGSLLAFALRIERVVGLERPLRKDS